MIDKQVLRSEPTNRPTDRPGLSVFSLFASFDFLKYTKIERIGRALFDKLVLEKKGRKQEIIEYGDRDDSYFEQQRRQGFC